MCPWLALELNRGTAFRVACRKHNPFQAVWPKNTRETTNKFNSRKLEFVIRLILCRDKQRLPYSNTNEDDEQVIRAYAFLVDIYDHDRQSSRVKSTICIRRYDTADGIKPNILFQTGGRVLAIRCCTSAPSARPRYDRPKCQEIYGLRLACTKPCHLHVRRYPLHRPPLFVFFSYPPSLFVERVLLSNIALRRHVNARIDLERSGKRQISFSSDF